jgi:hypothetical protein
MPITIQKISAEDLTTIFGRQARSAENVADYVNLLRGSQMAVGSGLVLQTQLVKIEGEDNPFTILAGSIDEEDPEGVTIRAAKRRFNMAAKQLGFSLDWRERENMLIMKAVELRVDEPADGKDE